MADESRSSGGRNLSRRERQIMDVIYARGQATAAEVLLGLPDPPSYSAVRALLRILEEKGQLRHRSEGGKYVYSPTHPRNRAGRSAMRRVLRTFFDNSTAKAVAALFEVSDTELTDREIGELGKLIERARRNGGKS